MSENIIDLLNSFLNNSIAVDMTRTLEEGMPKWPTQPPFNAVTYESMEWGFGSYHRGVSMSEHSGTHLDAGCHFVKGKPSVDEVPVTQIIGRAVNIDVTDTPPRGDAQLKKVIDFEEKYGEIKKGDIVFFRFGWDLKYALKPYGEEYVKDWPGISTEIGEYLLSKGVKAVGCDTMALDADGTTYPNHAILLGNDINIIENVDKLGELPKIFTVIGLPCKFKGGSGATMRLVAFVQK